MHVLAVRAACACMREADRAGRVVRWKNPPAWPAAPTYHLDPIHLVLHIQFNPSQAKPSASKDTWRP